MPEQFDGRNNAFDGPFRNKNLNKVHKDVLRMAAERKLGTTDQQVATGGDAGERVQNVAARMNLSEPFDRMPMPRQNKTGIIAFDDNSFQVNGDSRYKYRWVGNSLQALDVTKSGPAWRNVDTSKVAQTWEGWKMAETAPRNAAQLVDRAAVGAGVSAAPITSQNVMPADTVRGQIDSQFQNALNAQAARALPTPQLSQLSGIDAQRAALMQLFSAGRKAPALQPGLDATPENIGFSNMPASLTKLFR